MCYVTLTGLRLWLARRREGARSLGWLERAVTVVGFGLPFALVVSAVAFLVAMPLGSAVYWTPASFVIASSVAIVGGFFARSNDQLDRTLQIATGALLVVLPLIRLVTGGPGWAASLSLGQPIIVALDLGVLLGGGWMLWSKLGSQCRLAGARPQIQPAE